MKKAMTRITLASATLVTALSMGGAASASSINVSTQGPNSGVHISSGHTGWSSEGWGGHSNKWDDKKDWNHHENKMSDWDKHMGKEQCRGANHNWTWNKKQKCAEKSGWKQACVKTWSNCWGWVKKNCW